MKTSGRIVLVLLISFGCAGGNVFSSWAQAVEYSGSSFRDPFVSQLPKPIIEGTKQAGARLAEGQIQPPAIEVESQISGGPVPQAIIGGKIFRLGDKVQDALITKITKEGVEVLYQGRTFLYPAPSRKYAQSEGGKDAE